MSDQKSDTDGRRIKVVKDFDQLNTLARELFLRHMQDHGMNQKQLAEKLGIERTRINTWIRGKQMGIFGVYNILVLIGHDMAVVINSPDQPSEGKPHTTRVLM